MLFSDEDVKYKCKICHKYIRTPSARIIHERIHTGVKPFSCDTCNRSFARKSELKNHICSAKAKKSYVCTICNNSFSFQPKLKKHLEQFHQTQTGGDKPYSCSVCGKAFMRRLSVSAHMKIHRKECGVNDITNVYQNEKDPNIAKDYTDAQKNAGNIDISFNVVKSDNDTFDEDYYDIKNDNDILGDEAYVDESDNGIRDDGVDSEYKLISDEKISNQVLEDGISPQGSGKEHMYRYCCTCRTQTIYPVGLNLKIIGDFLCDRCILKTLCNKVSI